MKKEGLVTFSDRFVKNFSSRETRNEKLVRTVYNNQIHPVCFNQSNPEPEQSRTRAIRNWSNPELERSKAGAIQSWSNAELEQSRAGAIQSWSNPELEQSRAGVIQS